MTGIYTRKNARGMVIYVQTPPQKGDPHPKIQSRSRFFPPIFPLVTRIRTRAREGIGIGGSGIGSRGWVYRFPKDYPISATRLTPHLTRIRIPSSPNAYPVSCHTCRVSRHPSHLTRCPSLVPRHPYRVMRHNGLRYCVLRRASSSVLREKTTLWKKTF